jgi:hypothetical protein
MLAINLNMGRVVITAQWSIRISGINASTIHTCIIYKLEVSETTETCMLIHDLCTVLLLLDEELTSLGVKLAPSFYFRDQACNLQHRPGQNQQTPQLPHYAALTPRESIGNRSPARDIRVAARRHSARPRGLHPLRRRKAHAGRRRAPPTSTGDYCTGDCRLLSVLGRRRGWKLG